MSNFEGLVTCLRLWDLVLALLAVAIAWGRPGTVLAHYSRYSTGEVR